MPDHKIDHPDALINYRLSTMEDAVKSIAATLSQLTSLEQKHLETRTALERAFAQLIAQDERIRVVELEMPMLKMTRNWMIAGVLGAVTIIGVAIISLVTLTKIPSAAQTMQQMQMQQQNQQPQTQTPFPRQP